MNSPANPLLQKQPLPLFDRIRAEDVVPAIDQLLTEVTAALEALEESNPSSWDELILPLEEIDYRIQTTWGPVSHLLGVMNTPEFRAAYDEVLPRIVDFDLRLKQSPVLYQALKRLRNSPEWDSYEEARRRLIEQRLLSARNNGIELPPEKQEHFANLTRILSKLSTDFSNNVLDATAAFALDLSKADEIAGLPDTLLALAANSYRAAFPDSKASAENGPWRITLEAPSFLPFMQHSRRRDLREKIYRAFIGRASSDKTDNSEFIYQILKLRQEKAALLGYNNHAEYSLSEKMAENITAVDELLDRLRDAALKRSRAENEELTAFAQKSGHSGELKHWDIAFWSERMREEQFQYTEEELREYFPFENVLKGLFELVENIFQIKVEAADGSAPIWHDDVRYFQIKDKNGSLLAAFYLDPFSRPALKRGGAWMDECLSRRKVGAEILHPVAHLVCNSAPPLNGEPSLMTFREIETLFHEFGHGLQHMLTEVDYLDVSGINGVEWDAVELPSQFMENWCYHRPTIKKVSRHVKTGEQLPDELFEKILKARCFRAASNLQRQVYFSELDLALHSSFDPEKSNVFELQQEISVKNLALPLLPEDRFLCSFTHIFAGGYSAGYYSYKWAEVLSADAFSAFAEVESEPERISEIGGRFRREILAVGGSRPPLDAFRNFRGREPQPEPLLQQYGILTANE